MVMEDEFRGTCVASSRSPFESQSRGVQHYHRKVDNIACEPCWDIPLGFAVDPLLLAKQGRWEEYYADQTRRFFEAQWSRMTLNIIRRWETESACLASNTRHQIRWARMLMVVRGGRPTRQNMATLEASAGSYCGTPRLHLHCGSGVGMQMLLSVA